MGICNMFLNMCVVGLVGVSPNTMEVHLMDEQANIHVYQLEVRQISAEMSEGISVSYTHLTLPTIGYV